MQSNDGENLSYMWDNLTKGTLVRVIKKPGIYGTKETSWLSLQTIYPADNIFIPHGTNGVVLKTMGSLCDDVVFCVVLWLGEQVNARLVTMVHQGYFEICK